MPAQEKNPLTAAFEFIRSGSVRETESILRSHPELINQHTYFAGGTLLHYAAAESTSEVVKLLIDLGFDVNLKGKTYQDSALDSACCNGHLDNVKMLLQHGAKIVRAQSHTDPLFGAIIGRSPDIVRLLIENGVDPNKRHTLGSGAIVDAHDFAVMRGELECASVIVSLMSRQVQ